MKEAVITKGGKALSSNELLPFQSLYLQLHLSCFFSGAQNKD